MGVTTDNKFWKVYQGSMLLDSIHRNMCKLLIYTFNFVMHMKNIKEAGALTYIQNVLFIPNWTKSFPVNNAWRETDILKPIGMSCYRKHVWIDNVTSHTNKCLCCRCNNTSFTEISSWKIILDKLVNRQLLISNRDINE